DGHPAYVYLRRWLEGYAPDSIEPVIFSNCRRRGAADCVGNRVGEHAASCTHEPRARPALRMSGDCICRRPDTRRWAGPLGAPRDRARVTADRPVVPPAGAL